MREFIERVLSKLLEEKGQENCLNKLLNANGKNTSRSSSEISKWIGGSRRWPQPVRDLLSSSDTYRFILDCLKDKNHLALFKDTHNELDKRAQQMEAAPLLIKFQKIEAALNNVNLDMGKKLVATGIHSFLCFLISDGFLNETIRDSDVHYFLDEQDKKTRDVGGRAIAPENTLKATELDIAQSIYKKSCEIYSQLVDGYSIDEALFPSLSANVTGNCQIIGDGGSGKSTFLIKRFKELKTAYEKDSANNLLPIYIPLNQYKGIAVHGEHYIKDYIAGIDSGKFALVSCKMYLMLDGANESPYASQLGKEIQDLLVLGCTILITSRYKLEWNCLKTFSCVKLYDLDDKVIQEVLASKHLPIAEGRLLETLRRPMWLALYSGLKNIAGINTPGEILCKHHNWLLSKVSADLQGEEYTEQHRNALAYIPKLANLTKGIVFNIKDIENDVKAFLPQTLPIDVFQRIAVSSGLIKIIGPDPHNGGTIYQWSHEHYLDYYQAAYVCNDIMTCKGNLPLSASTSLLSIPVLTFLGDLLGEYRQPTVESCLKRFAVGRRGTSAQIACRNLIDVMKIARNRHLENFCFDNLDFYRVNFDGCWISGSTFTRTQFSPAFLSEQNASFLDDICYLPKHDLLLTNCQQDEKLSVWDYSNAEFIGSISLGKGIVSIDASPDEQKLAVAFWDDNLTVLVYDVNAIINQINADVEANIIPILSDQVYQTIVAEDDLKDFYVGTPRFLAFNSDSSILLCAHGYGEITLWSLNTGERLPSRRCIDLEQDWRPSNFTLSPFRMSLLICSEEDDRNILSVYDIENDECETLYEGYAEIDAVTFSPDERQVICRFSCYNDDEEEAAKSYIKMFVNPFAICQEGIPCYKQVKLVATEEYIFYSRGYNGDPVEKYEYHAQEVEKINNINTPSHGVLSFRVNELVLFPQQTVANGNLIVIDAESNKELRAFGAKPFKTTKYSLSFIGHTEILRISEDGQVDRYNWQKKRMSRDAAFSRLLKQHSGVCTFSRIVGDYYFYVKDNHVLDVWDINTRQCIQTFVGDFNSIEQIGLSTNPCYLILTRKYSNDILVGDTGSGALNVLSCNNLGEIFCVDISSAQAVYGASDGYIRIRNLIKDALLFSEKLHDSEISAVAMVPDSTLIITASVCGDFQVYDWHNRERLFHWYEESQAHYAVSVQITPLRKDRSIIQNNRWGILSTYLFDHDGFKLGIYVPDPAFKVDYKYLVSNDRNVFAVYDSLGILYVYNTTSGKILLEEKLSPDWWRTASLSKDGCLVLVANNSGQVLGWDTATKDQVISWNYSNCEDLCGADFRKSVGLSNHAKQIIRENGGIL